MNLLVEDSSGFPVVVEPGNGSKEFVLFKFDHSTDFFHVSRETLYEILRVLEAL